VLADFAFEALKWAEHDLRRRLPRASITSHDILKAWNVEHAQGSFDAWCSRPGFCENLMVLPGARWFVERLRERYEVVVVTSPYSAAPTWCYERLKWLDVNFGIPKQDVIFAKRKELVEGDALIDDYERNTEAFRGLAILMNQPWNQHVEGQLRAFNYQQALDILGRVFGGAVAA
jgi:5'(3')-deoxyribonucleotidase